MNVTVDCLKFGENGRLIVKKNGMWFEQYCPLKELAISCGLWCPLCNQDYDGCVTLCQDRILLPQHIEEPKQK